jgi:orotate phosphoribosyltransferase
MEELTLESMTACGSHQQGHFLLSSGFHSADYLQCALFLAHPRRAATAGSLVAQALTAMAIEPDLVVAPAMGGLIIGHETARALDRPFIFTERVGSEMALRRGFGVAAGQKVVIIEDVVTTGKSTREVIALLENRGAEVIAMASMVNRSGIANPFAPLPYRALLEVTFATWAAEACPLCRNGMPITKPGSRPVA